MVLPWHIHHAETTEVSTSDGHEDAPGAVDVVVVDEDRHVSEGRLEVAEAEEGNEEEAQDDG